MINLVFRVAKAAAVPASAPITASSVAKVAVPSTTDKVSAAVKPSDKSGVISIASPVDTAILLAEPLTVIFVPTTLIPAPIADVPMTVNLSLKNFLSFSDRFW